MVVKMIENPRAEKKLKTGKVSIGRKRKRLQKQVVESKVKPVKVEEKSILVAKELKFVKYLAGNDPKLRRKVLKNLKIWLNTRSRSSFAFTDTDFLRLWKGLFYCFWMSDKPLIQENLADEIASLVRCFKNLSLALQYFGAFLKTMSIEWFGIDNWRIDKFMMLVRRCTRQMLVVLHEAEWPEQQVKILMKYVDQFLLNSEKCPFGLTKHFGDLLLEEVAKVSEGDINAGIIHTIVEAYAIRLLSTNDMRLIKHITSNVFHSLLYQSELGQDYQEKFDLWKKTNFVTGNIDSVDYEVNCEYEDKKKGDNDQDNASDEEDQEEKVFDPRAGQVDVVINELHFDPLKIVEIFETNQFKPFVTSKGRKQMKMLVKQYKKFATGVFPLGIQTVDSIDKKDYKVDIEEQIEELENFERELVKEKPGKKKFVDAASLEAHGTQMDKTETDSPKKATKKTKKKKIPKNDLKQQKLLLLKAKREQKLEFLKEKKLAKSKSFPVSANESNVQNPSSSSKSFEKAVSETSFASTSPTNGTFKIADEWSEPLKDGETEKFISSRRTKFKQIKKQLAEEELATFVRNPFATSNNNANTLKRMAEKTQTDDGVAVKKRVKIALNKNVSQDLKDHINQVLSSPQVPYDSRKKPSKGALKPNLMPSPINPFYRKKIGLKLNNTH